MTYYFAKTLAAGWDDAIARTTEALKQEGFGVISEIDVRDTLKKKLNIGSALIESWAPAIQP